VPYTKSIARACQSFTQQPDCPTDTLIAPILNACELLCRVNDFYSYDDIETSEVIGESTIDISTCNFRAELQQLRDTLPAAIMQNCMYVTESPVTDTDKYVSDYPYYLRYARHCNTRMFIS
jgi:hypothetical protein